MALLPSRNKHPKAVRLSASTTYVARRAKPVRLWLWACSGGLLGLLWGIVAFAPAQWLENAVNAASGGRVLLSQSTGTVWEGSAYLLLSGGSGSTDASRLPSRLEWQASLGWGTLRLALRSACCTTQPVEVVLAPRWQGWRVQLAAGESRWPAALLSGLGTPWNTVQPQGNVLVSTQGLAIENSLQRWTIDGALQIDMQDMQSRLSTLRPLGSYRVLISGGAQPSLDLSTLKGDLKLSGQGRWSGGHLRFTGQAQAEPAHTQELSNLLNIMGRRDGVRSIITFG